VDAVLCIAERVGDHVGEFPTAPVAQHGTPGIEGTRHHRRQQAGAWHQVEAEHGKSFRSGGIWRHTLAAHHVLRACTSVVHDDGRVTAGAVQMRFGHLQHEASGHGGVEGIAALFQHGHANLARKPMRCRHYAKGAGNFWARREHRGPLSWLRSASYRQGQDFASAGDLG